MDIRLDVDRIDNAEALDPAVKVVRNAVNSALPQGPLKDALNGVWLGHPVHPVAVQMPVGAWTSAAVLDAVPAAGPAATLLIGVGTLSAARPY